MTRAAAEIIREYGPFPGVDRVNGVTFDGKQIWFAAGDKLSALDPASGKVLRSIDVAAHAGTAFDGQHLFASRWGRFEDTDPAGGNDKQSGAGFALAEQHFTGGKMAHHRTRGKRIQLRLI